jgi:hypothetical protein
MLTVKNVDGQNVEWDKRLAGKTLKGKKTFKGQNVEWKLTSKGHKDEGNKCQTGQCQM